MTASGHLASAHDAITDRAAEFFERRRFGTWNAADQAELEAWFAQSILHEVAYLRLEGAVARTEKLSALRPFSSTQAEPAPANPAYRRFAIPLLAAACVALGVVLGIPYLEFLMQPPVHSFTTDVGGRTLLRFADGTEFELNTNTAVRYRMTNRERTVWLDRGEAWFHVAHTPQNPFVLLMGTHRIVDLGTEFFVRRSSDLTEVALLNGRASLSTEGAQTATLRPGDDAIATPVSVSVTRKTAGELADALAWRRGVLVFRDEKLADAVRDINRYSMTKVVIADASIADIRLTGEIRDDTLDDFLYLAQSVMKLRVDRQGREVLLSRDPKTKSGHAAHARAASP
jgi:transmembrane sensor